MNRDHGTCRQPTVLEHGGRALTVVQWAQVLGICPATVRARLRRGWPLERVLTPGRLSIGPRAVKEKPAPPVESAEPICDDVPPDGLVGRRLTVHGVTRSVAAWSKATGVPTRVIRRRLAKGVAPADAVDPTYVETDMLNTVDPAEVTTVDPVEVGVDSLVGRTFNELTVTGLVAGRRGDNVHAKWLCRCSCGRFTVAQGRALRTGKVKSCGHLKLWNGGDRAKWVTNHAPVTPVDDLTGRVYGQLTVVERVDGPWEHVHWRCRCTCGGEAVVDGTKLRNGHTRSCGCRRGRRPGATRSARPEYRHWRAMRARCADVGNPDYGGRGIRVCPEWADFWTFLEDVGPKPGKGWSLERLDVNGDYAPGNVVWADRVTQANNTRRNRRLTVNGETRTVAEWARVSGLPAMLITDRLRRGWPAARAVFIKTWKGGRDDLASAKQPEERAFDKRGVGHGRGQAGAGVGRCGGGA